MGDVVLDMKKNALFLGTLVIEMTHYSSAQMDLQVNSGNAEKQTHVI